MSEDAHTSNNTFPQEIEVTLKFKIKVTTPEDKAYFVNDSGAASVSFLADILDSWLDIDNSKLVSVNDINTEKISQALQAAAGL